MPVINLTLNATGGSAATQMFSGVANSVAAGGQRINEAVAKCNAVIVSLSKNIEGTSVSVADLRKHMADTGATLQGAIRHFQLTGDAAEKAGNAFRKAGNDQREASRDIASIVREEERAVTAAKQAEVRSTEQAIHAQEQAAQRYRNTLQEVRNAGLGMMMAGQQGMNFAEPLIQGGLAAERANSKMEAMLEKRGEGGRFEEMGDWAKKLAYNAALVDDDPIKEATAGLQGFGMQAERVKSLMSGLIGQTRLYNQGQVNTANLTATAEAVGRAYGKGDTSGLARIGVTLGDEDLARINELKARGASLDERQAAMYDILKNSFSKYALSMTEGLGETEIASNRAALAMDGVSDNFGLGAAKAKTGLQQLVSQVLNLGDTSNGAQQQTGKLFYYLSAFGSVAGGVISVGSQVGLLKLAFRKSTVAAKLLNLVSFSNLSNGFIGLIGKINAATIAQNALNFAMSPAGRLLAGVGIGLIGAEGIRRARVAAGDKAAPGSFGEMLSNTWARFTGDEEGVTDLTGKTMRQKREESAASQAADQQASDQAKAQNQLESLFNGGANSGVAGVPDGMVNAFHANESKSTAFDEKEFASPSGAREGSKIWKEEMRDAKAEAKRLERESTQAAGQAARENATGLLGAAKVQAAERKAATKEEIESLTSARKAERRDDEDAQERINRGYELAHARARNLDMEHMEGIVALQKAGFSLDQIGTARDVYKSLQQSGAAKETPEDRLRESWAKEDRSRNFRRDQEDKDEALRHREDALRGEGNADAGSLMAQAKSRGAWGKNADIMRAHAAAQEQIARIKAGQNGNAEGSSENEIEYSNASGTHRIRVPQPRAVRSGKKVRFEFEPFEAEIDSRSDRDARSYG